MSLFLGSFIAAVIMSCGKGHPVGREGNVTTPMSYRMQKATVKFPPDSNGGSMDWSRFSAMNLSRATASDDPFVFPDELPKKPRFTPMVSKRSPACAKGSTFCEDVDDYPGDYLSTVLSNKVDEFQAIMGVDEVRETGIGHRIDGIDENPLCASIEELVYPKTAKTKDDKWLYVVNQGPYTQGVRIEKCITSSGQTACEYTQNFPFGYKTMCKQKYIYRKLVALDEKGEAITDTFQLPSCCSCIVKNESLRARIGSMGRLPTTPSINSKRKESKRR